MKSSNDRSGVTPSADATLKTHNGEEEMADVLPSSSLRTSMNAATSSSLGKKKKEKKVFRFTDHPHRKIALRLAYHGHAHDGLAIQRDTPNTVEGILCEALQEVRLIPPSSSREHNMKTEQPRRKHEEEGKEKCHAKEDNILELPVKEEAEVKDDHIALDISRCGRTDKGVSALGNCISLICRASCWPQDDPQHPPLDYCTKLNRILPSTVRVIGYAHVPPDFDARFSCTARTYRYYFWHKGLDVEAMKTAAQYLVGTHNFRNFCVLDVVNVSNLERHMMSVGIYPSETLPECMAYVELKANSFLYHQVRCIMSILFLVGRHLEPPSVVHALLHNGDKKPFYPLAESDPLMLWECHYDTQSGDREVVSAAQEACSGRVEWKISEKGLEEVQQSLLDISTALCIRAASVNAMRQQLSTWYPGKGDCYGNHGSHAPHYPLQDNGYADRSHDTSRSSSASSSVLADSWSPTGYDWTLPHADGFRRARYFSAIKEKNQEKKLLQELQKHTAHPKEEEEREKELLLVVSSLSHTVTGEEKSTGVWKEEEELKARMKSIYFTRDRVRGYIPLLLRESERTFEEQIQQLSGTKRARYENNMRKKKIYEEAVVSSK